MPPHEFGAPEGFGVAVGVGVGVEAPQRQSVSDTQSGFLQRPLAPLSSLVTLQIKLLWQEIGGLVVELHVTLQAPGAGVTDIVKEIEQTDVTTSEDVEVGTGVVTDWLTTRQSQMGGVLGVSLFLHCFPDPHEDPTVLP